MLAGSALTATAQTNEIYCSEKFKDNIFISAGVGTQACMNPDNLDYGTEHAITPLIHVSVGKLFNPVWRFCGQVAGPLVPLSVFAGPGLTFAKTYGNQDMLNALMITVW